MPYGDTLDGSARRTKYVKDLELYMASALQPILESWEGELPTHLQKVRTLHASILALGGLPIKDPVLVMSVLRGDDHKLRSLSSTTCPSLIS